MCWCGRNKSCREGITLCGRKPDVERREVDDEKRKSLLAKAAKDSNTGVEPMNRFSLDHSAVTLRKPPQFCGKCPFEASRFLAQGKTLYHDDTTKKDHCGMECLVHTREGANGTVQSPVRDLR